MKKPISLFRKTNFPPSLPERIPCVHGGGLSVVVKNLRKPTKKTFKIDWIGFKHFLGNVLQLFFLKSQLRDSSTCIDQKQFCVKTVLEHSS